MRVVCLVENHTCNKKVKAANGLSLYFETNNLKFLFDCGPDDTFIRNANLLSIDLKDVDYVVISHMHNAHIGGLNSFLELNTKAKVITKPGINESYGHTLHNILTDLSTEIDLNLHKDRFILNEYSYDINENISLFTAEKINMNIELFNNDQIDDFKHEQTLKITDNDHIYIFTGCSHSGIFNILDSVNTPIYTLFGGFHLITIDDEIDDTFSLNDDQIQEFSNKLLTYNINHIYTGHCTTKSGVKKLNKLNPNIRHLITAKEYEF